MKVMYQLQLTDKIFQIEIHQTCIFAGILLGEETKAITFVKASGGSKSINGDKSASSPIAMSKDMLHIVYYVSSYPLPSVCLADSKTSHLYSRIVIALFAERYFSIDAITYTLLRFAQPNNVIQQTEISSDISTLLMNDKICTSQKLCLIISRFVNQEFIQVTFGTFKEPKTGFLSQVQNIKIVSIHLKREQFGELRLAASYANLARSLSSADTGDGCSMCQRKRSASAPVSMGVSLMGLAIVYFLSFLISLQRYEIKFETTKQTR